MKYTAIIDDYQRHINLDAKLRRRVLSITRYGSAHRLEVVITSNDPGSIGEVITVDAAELVEALKRMFP